MQPPRNVSMSLTVLAAIGLLSTPLKTQAGDEGPTGSIVGWGRIVLVDLSGPVAAGLYHSLGLKSDGSIVAWGDSEYGQTNVPVPNADFIAVAGGADHSLGLKALMADLNLDGRVDLADHVGMVACLAECIHNNPVRRGWVAAPTDWTWSTAQWYAGEPDCLVTMDAIPSR